MTTNYGDWQPIDQSDEPRDQQRDLHGPFWAEIGPDSRHGWSWTVLESADGGDATEVAYGYAATEVAAKAAVAAWAGQP